MRLRIWSFVVFGPVTISHLQGPRAWEQAGSWLYVSLPFLSFHCEAFTVSATFISYQHWSKNTRGLHNLQSEKEPVR